MDAEEFALRGTESVRFESSVGGIMPTAVCHRIRDQRGSDMKGKGPRQQPFPIVTQRLGQSPAFVSVDSGRRL